MQSPVYDKDGKQVSPHLVELLNAVMYKYHSETAMRIVQDLLHGPNDGATITRMNLRTLLGHKMIRAQLSHLFKHNILGVTVSPQASSANTGDKESYYIKWASFQNTISFKLKRLRQKIQSVSKPAKQWHRAHVSFKCTNIYCKKTFSPLYIHEIMMPSSKTDGGCTLQCTFCNWEVVEDSVPIPQKYSLTEFRQKYQYLNDLLEKAEKWKAPNPIWAPNRIRAPTNTSFVTPLSNTGPRSRTDIRGMHVTVNISTSTPLLQPVIKPTPPWFEIQNPQ